MNPFPHAKISIIQLHIASKVIFALYICQDSAPGQVHCANHASDDCYTTELLSKSLHNFWMKESEPITRILGSDGLQKVYKLIHLRSLSAIETVACVIASMNSELCLSGRVCGSLNTCILLKLYLKSHSYTIM